VRFLFKYRHPLAQQRNSLTLSKCDLLGCVFFILVFDYLAHSSIFYNFNFSSKLAWLFPVPLPRFEIQHLDTFKYDERNVYLSAICIIDIFYRDFAIWIFPYDFYK
jgi:hypothetical protein